MAVILHLPVYDYRKNYRARDWRGLATPQAGPERSGAPESPVSGAKRRKCAQITRKIFINVKLLQK
jgi:hypothetical protein